MTVTAIIGLGNMGKGLARRLAGKTGLVVAARDANGAKAFAATLPAGSVTVADPAEAVAKADIVVLGLPFAAALEFAGKANLAGKVLVDMTNPVKPDYSGLALGHTTSAAEELQNASPRARVVKAFNTIFAGLLDAPASQTADVPVFLAGNDEAAVDQVADLVTRAGFAPQKAGGLEAARLIEPLGMLNIRFAYGLGHGTAIAPAWVKLAA
ncbi:MAG TPA: NAD(P)-binding domain-containing protein [Bauldia sp.]|nr:NAD(P)-binding domain-containing protein [Bauldia sp.]